MNNVASALGQAALAAGNILATPVMYAGGIANQALTNIDNDFKPPMIQRQLPQGVQSPVPQSSLTPESSGSWLGYGMQKLAGAGAGALNQGLSNLQQAARPQPYQALPPGVANPVPGSQVVPRNQGSWLGNGVQQVVNNIMAPRPQQQVLGAQTTPAPTQVPMDTPSNVRPVNTPPTPTPQPQYAYSEPPKGATPYEIQAAPIFQKYGVPPEIGLAMYGLEGRGKTINPNNPYNIGAYDSNPQNANNYKFKTPLEGTEEAAKFLAGQSQFQSPQVRQIFQTALAQYKQTNDSDTYFKTIAPVYASDPNYTTKAYNTPEYKRWSYDNS